jgi:molybdopterin synthase sulfur carrier subunit
LLGQPFSAGLFGAVRLNGMPTVKMTRHLYRFFPALENRTVTVPAGSVAEVLRAVDEIAPGFTEYVLDERGALRRHVYLSINDTVVVDRTTLADRVPEEGTVYIFQALSGG